ncbi:MAG: phage tail protein I [Eubacterium sp.]|nr:phage tail protein I [Eubacterium sp.]
MSNTAYNVDFARLLPEPLKNDETMLALGRAISGELQQNIQLARFTIIYPRIDELDETTLDILARDLHVDWYNDAYPIEAKRAVIKSSVQIHKRLGTKYAVVKALGDLFPNTEVQEWFEYGGTHHHFRIILDLTNAKAPADLLQIVNAAKFYKRLSAHLEEVIYQMSVVIEIHTGTEFFKYKTGQTNTYKTGTRPRRNTIGGISGAMIDIAAESAGGTYRVAQTGTTPYRSTLAELNGTSITAHPETEAHKSESGRTGRYSAGENPHRNTGGGTAQEITEIKTSSDNYGFLSKQSGTKPARNIEWVNVDNGLTVQTETTDFPFSSEQSGKAPKRNTEYINFNNSVSAETTADSFLYTVEMTGQSSAGENPQTNTEGQNEKGGIAPTVTAEGFSYRVRRCGTGVAKNNKKG